MKRMKLCLTALAICAFQLMATADPSGPKSLPTAVSSAFTHQYPSAHLRNWELRNDEYIVNFRGQSESSAAYYMSDGTWLRTDTKLSGKKELPENVRRGLARSDYRKYDIQQIDKILQPAGKTQYMLHVGYGANVENDRVIYFDQSGRLETVTGAPAKASQVQ